MGKPYVSKVDKATTRKSSAKVRVQAIGKGLEKDTRQYHEGGEAVEPGQPDRGAVPEEDAGQSGEGPLDVGR